MLDIRNLLKPDGYVAIIIPNINSFIDNIIKSKNENLNKEDHLFHYSTKTLANLLDLAGLEIVTIRTREPIHHWIITLKNINFGLC